MFAEGCCCRFSVTPTESRTSDISPPRLLAFQSFISETSLAAVTGNSAARTLSELGGWSSATSELRSAMGTLQKSDRSSRSEPSFIFNRLLEGT